MSRFALQTFTVRNFLKPPAVIETGFRRIKDTGLNAVELAYIKLQPEELGYKALF